MGRNIPLKEKDASQAVDEGAGKIGSLVNPVHAQPNGQAQSTSSPLDNELDSAEPKQGTSVVIWKGTDSEGPRSLACLNAYFHHVHRAYPFVDKARIMQVQSANVNVVLIENDADSMVSLIL